MDRSGSSALRNEMNRDKQYGQCKCRNGKCGTKNQLPDLGSREGNGSVPTEMIRLTQGSCKGNCPRCQNPSRNGSRGEMSPEAYTGLCGNLVRDSAARIQPRISAQVSEGILCMQTSQINPFHQWSPCETDERVQLHQKESGQDATNL
jgi:hypothetical protein